MKHRTNLSRDSAINIKPQKPFVVHPILANNNNVHTHTSQHRNTPTIPIPITCTAIPTT